MLSFEYHNGANFTAQRRLFSHPFNYPLRSEVTNLAFFIIKVSHLSRSKAPKLEVIVSDLYLAEEQIRTQGYNFWKFNLFLTFSVYGFFFQMSTRLSIFRQKMIIKGKI